MHLRLVLLTFVVTMLAGRAVAQTAEQAYHVKPGDVLQISVWGEPELQGPALVGPDGTFSFPLVGHLDAKGKTAAELQEIVVQRLSEYLSTPVATVSLAEVNGNKIFVIGQVNNPGEFVMGAPVDVMQALSMAGGANPFASLDNILILRRNGDEQVALPFRYSQVIRGRDLNQNILLQSGDVVVVP
jgi:polysaccharide export outer membrane protein